MSDEHARLERLTYPMPQLVTAIVSTEFVPGRIRVPTSHLKNVLPIPGEFFVLGPLSNKQVCRIRGNVRKEPVEGSDPSETG